MRTISILGSTGTIGVNTLDVIERHPDRFRVGGLAAHRDVETLFEQCVKHRPRVVALFDADAASVLQKRVREAQMPCEVLAGAQGLAAVASLPEVEAVMAGIVGAAGLEPTLAAARAGKRVLLANKEALVMAGELFMQTVREARAQLLPIDSEHNAVFQALPRTFDGSLEGAGVRRILLTASGGPFRNLSAAAMRNVTPEEACRHPNWRMGRKISVDSATMMNKGLEVIEAHYLFNAPSERIEIVIHPQSIIHSLVEYVDGSFIAQLGHPDMRTPIAYALGFPERIEAGTPEFKLSSIGQLSFEAPDITRFPCIRLAYEALDQGGSAPIVLNAANEVAVDRFLAGALRFDGIAAVIEQTLAVAPRADVGSLSDAVTIDAEARTLAQGIITRWQQRAS